MLRKSATHYYPTLPISCPPKNMVDGLYQLAYTYRTFSRDTDQLSVFVYISFVYLGVHKFFLTIS